MQRLVALLDSLPKWVAHASSSLAIYIVHFRYIHIVDALNVEFPYNVAQVYLYSIIFAYSLTRLSGYMVNYFLMATNNRS